MNTHAVIPLAVLEAVRSADIVSTVSGLADAGHVPEVRLGGSPTIMAQIGRYQKIARRRGRVTAADVGGILKLIGRRRDADLVMAEAGRWAGEYAASAHPGRIARWGFRIAPGPLRRRVGDALVRRIARSVFAVEISSDQTAEWSDPDGLRPSSGGLRVCEFFRAATAETLRRYTAFDGALFHLTCQDDGQEVCTWGPKFIEEEDDHVE